MRTFVVNKNRMTIDQHILDELTAAAKASPRLRMNLDLRNSEADGSQRMLNAMEPGTVLPIHRHRSTSETVVCLRGHLRELFYDAGGAVTEVIAALPLNASAEMARTGAPPSDAGMITSSALPAR